MLLSVRGLAATHGDVPVLHGVDLEVARGECVALVGQSGSGKTTLARCIIGLHRDFTGEIALQGEPLHGTARKRTAAQRQQLQYVFQSPYASLNPRRSIGLALERQVRLYGGGSRREVEQRAMTLLERVALPTSVAARYPDELSGGERQRVAIARALAAGPSVLVCDEVTSALDVSVQAAIVALLEELRTEDGLALLFVTHNLALIRTMADRVAVLNAGRLVEDGETQQVFEAPQAAYTSELLSNTPTLTEDARTELRAGA